jgi:hypothetical protein
MVEEVSAASENLDEQVDNMRDLIAVFDIGEGIASTGASKAPEKSGGKVVEMNKPAALSAKKRARDASRVAAKAVSKAASQAEKKAKDDEWEEF